MSETLDKATFLRLYVPITWRQHARAVRHACTHETWGPEDVLVEEDGDTVRLYPASSMPYRWRTLWRKREKEIS
jgi:hypothetical protein